jgi:transcriptional regulator with XRE-family HTH domain
MMNISDNNLESMSDNALVERLGLFIKHHRLQQNKTQSQLAEEAGINRSTLNAFERGMRSNIITLIQLLRALDQLQVLQAFEISPQISPILLAEMEHAYRKRASKKKPTDKKPESDW